MELPLLERIREFDAAGTPAAGEGVSVLGSFCGIAPATPAKTATMPLRSPGPGEQYRFHFDMTRCIGCKCCVVACNEQNGNPADILWRRVGEIEGGSYPDTRRHYLSIGCNQCLEPTCMTGCPVDAYSKDSITGIVRHSADACIGCQYCTWNCSYGVPQYNPERGVVGKCDMCYGRLQLGQSPACASACPEEAIQIEIVRVDEWRAHYREHANSPGMPSADHSLSTTRITLPATLPGNLDKVDLGYLRLETPHWPLIVMTVLTQLSVGTFIAIWLLQILGFGAHRLGSMMALFAAFVALSASTLHLGRPIHAARALRMWRRSWLSREVLLFTIFACAAAAYSISLLLRLPHTSVLGAATVLFGIAGVGASARLYLAPGRPAWNSPFTIAEFFATAALMGCASAMLLGGRSNAGLWILLSALFCIGSVSGKLAWLATSSSQELFGTWQAHKLLLSGRLFVRFIGLVAGASLICLASSKWLQVSAAILMLGGEFLGRYLFFVSVVPSNIASGFLAREAA
jgi:formate dehydrogenase iron-sulfur subunit